MIRLDDLSASWHGATQSECIASYALHTAYHNVTLPY